MKKITLTIALLVVTFGFSQTVINFDATAFSPDPTGVGAGFMNVFDNPKDGSIGGFQFDSGWGIPDLVSELNTGANTITLKPNRIGDPDPYWQTTGVLEGNKIMDANTFIQDDALAGTIFSFTGEVATNSLDATGLSIGFSTTAFIKVFSADFSAVVASDIVDLTPGTFSLVMDATSFTSGEHVQYGFQFVGPNISSDTAFDTDYDNIGSIVVQPAVLSTDEFEISDFAVYPNPTLDTWNIKSNTIVTSVQVHDILGKQVISLKPNLNEVAIDASVLNDGIYLAKITSANGTKTIKLVKN